MSKAFTKDEGAASTEDVARPLGAPLPEGAKNYVTPEGAAALRERQAAALARLAKGRASADGAMTALAEQQLDFTNARLAALEEVATPPPEAQDKIRFGATVLVADEDGQERRVQIVGLDEADAARGRISWTSPLARALLGHAAGDEVRLRTPQGSNVLEVVAITYG